MTKSETRMRCMYRTKNDLYGMPSSWTTKPILSKLFELVTMETESEKLLHTAQPVVFKLGQLPNMNTTDDVLTPW